MTRPVASTLRWMRLSPLLGAGAVLVACSTSVPFDPPSQAEARAYVARAIGLALDGDLEALCAAGGGNCDEILEQAGDIPAAPPLIVDVFEVPNQRHPDGSWTLGGQMVELCGHRDDGSVYRTQMLVFRDNAGRLIAIEPIYWSGIGIIIGGPPVTTGATPSFDCPLAR